MREKGTRTRRYAWSKAVPRRDALRGLGALAVSLPTLASLGCSTEDDPEAKKLEDAQEDDDDEQAGGKSDSGAQGKADAGTGSRDSGVKVGSSSDAGSKPRDSGSSGPSDVDAGSEEPAGDAGSNGTKPDAGGSNAGANGDFFPPNFQDAGSCTLTATDPAGEGPFFLHESEVMDDETMIRSDTRDGRPGVELQLNLRVLDASDGCMTPIKDVEVYIWHTDALGWYSGFNNQNPDQTYMGAFERMAENDDRFCRGIQVTNADGVVSFRTLYPGWYFGRPIHIHFVALKKGSGAGTMSYRSAQYHIFTTQMYFEEKFSRNIHENYEPYTMRASGSGYEMFVKPSSSKVRPTARMEGDVAVASLNIVTRANESRR